MESPSLFSSPFALLVTALVTIGVIKLVIKLYHQYTFWFNKGIPYLFDIFPLMGNTWKVFLRRMSFAEFAEFVYYHYPNAKYIGFMDFITPIVLVRDQDLIRDITVKDFEHFTDHRSFVDETVDPLFGKNVFALRGNRWKEMRNTLSPSFTASKMKLMVELISKCAREFTDYLIDHPEICTAIDTKEAFRRYTTDVIATSAFGINVNSMKEKNNEFYLRGVESSNFSGFISFLKFIFLRASPQLAKLFGISFFKPAIGNFFKRIVQETITLRKEKGIVRPDMIHLLMQAQLKEDDTARELSLEDIVSQAFIFFLAGFDTASTMMCFLTHELAVHQDIQDRLRQEVEEQTKENSEITYEMLSKMTYMDMVICEALRKYPPVVLIDRICVKRYELPPAQENCKSFVVEPETTMWIPVYPLHHDPKNFPNPSKFDPERFNEENKDKIPPYAYLPFGQGPRKCIGNRFVIMETKLLIANLLRKFVLKTTEKTMEPVIFDKSQFNLHPKGGFWVQFEKREKA